MIAFVQGRLEAIEESSVLVETGGIGYRIYTPIQEELLRLGIGSQVRFYTYMNVREDAVVLYGFLRKESLDLFRLLINVNGVGPKYALAILTSLHEDQVCLAIGAEDAKTLSRVPGIGPKTAARIILDLKDKIKGLIPTEGASLPAPELTVARGASEEAVMALMSLGYSQSEAAGAVAKAAEPGMDTEEIIKRSLKQII